MWMEGLSENIFDVRRRTGAALCDCETLTMVRLEGKVHTDRAPWRVGCGCVACWVCLRQRRQG